MARLLLGAVRGYQVLLSPFFAGSCRYTPSCSQYMAEALLRHGAARGSWLGLKRLARCRPFGGSGFDPVPDLVTPRRHGTSASLAPLSPRPGGEVR